jgi:hypothetical protein
MEMERPQTCEPGVPILAGESVIEWRNHLGCFGHLDCFTLSRTETNLSCLALPKTLRNDKLFAVKPLSFREVCYWATDNQNIVSNNPCAVKIIPIAATLEFRHLWNKKKPPYMCGISQLHLRA